MSYKLTEDDYKKLKTNGYDATCLDCGGEIEMIRHKSYTGGDDGGVPENGWCECNDWMMLFYEGEWDDR